MVRLTKSQAAEYRSRLSAWQSFADATELMREVRERQGFYAVSQGAAKFWREMHVALYCAGITHAKRVRLGDDPPDFELDYGDHRRAFEIVNALPPGRQLGAEYDAMADLMNTGKSVPITHLDVEGELEDAPLAVDAAIRSKAAKGYEMPLVLVVDIFHFVIARSDRDAERQWVRSAQKALGSFIEIWLKNGSDLIRVTPNGISRLSHPWPAEA
ncbi:hypothetical protein [Caulobacter sp. NIBR2454]|uniref:hypothetical protein n=1 Tax=Caulobacter sp. NIBR2454 TaxID=3015996 RepID=UPI0022B66FD7|nr:hypothetical protein [Caulobacter sp. NIBR2454]